MQNDTTPAGDLQDATAPGLDMRTATRRIADLPGPVALPLLGNLHQFDFKRLHQTMEQWARRYGPIYRVKIPRGAFLVVSDPALIASVLRERPERFRRPAVLAAVAAELGAMPGLFDSEGDAWRKQRRMVMQAFAPAAVKSYFPSLVQVAERLQRRWESAAAAGRATDLCADLRLYSVDIVAGLAFGTDVNTIETGDNLIQRNLDAILPGVAWRTLMPFPYWRYLKLPVDRRLERSVGFMRAAVTGLIEEARERMRLEPERANHPPNLLEAMLAAAAQGDSGVSDAEVAGNVSTMLLAGEDTTSNSLAWLIWLMQQHPAALARAREEVLRLAPGLDGLGIEQLDRLEFVEACIHESMRIKPAAPYISAEANQDSVVGGVAIPKGGIVLCLMRDINPDNPRMLHADRFDPERWLQDTIDRKASMPFGAGPRICPGRYLALIEIKLAMAMLLARFDIASLATAHGGEPDETVAFAMAPETLHMRLRLRAAHASA